MHGRIPKVMACSCLDVTPSSIDSEDYYGTDRAEKDIMACLCDQRISPNSRDEVVRGSSSL